MSDYSSIQNPYDDMLARQSDSAVVAGPTAEQMSEQADYSSADTSGSTGGITGSGSGSGGSVETTAVKSSGAMSDLWINTFIRSNNWQPKKAGFYIDGQTGYAEFTNVFISGPIVATTGTIGGFVIGSDYIRDVANSMGLASTVTGGNDVRFWAGDTYANRATAPFTVKESGLVTASNIVITGGVIDVTALSGIISQSNLDVANAGWSQTCAFSVTDSDTVAWGTGSFITASGTTYSISAGNTGNMAAKTYIYLDTNVSLTVYQTTTTAATAVGAGKVLIAVAQNNTTEATFQTFGGAGGQNIDASSIVASSITANEIAASTITAGKMNVSTLSSITADLGAITAGTIVVPSGGYFRSGQTDYDTGTGWWLGNASGTPKFSIGNSAGNKVTWDGSAITVVGAITASSGAIGGFTIGADYIRDAANSFGLASTVTGGDDVRFWAGDTFTNRATAPFRVTEAGAVTASNLSITGGSVSIGGNSVIDSSGNATFIGVTSLNVKAYTNFEGSGRFITTTGGSGSATFGNQGVTLAPGSTSTSYCRMIWWVTNQVFNNNPSFVVSLLALSLNAATGSGGAFVGFGLPSVAGTGYVFNDNHACAGFFLQKVGASTVDVYALQQKGDSTNFSQSGVLTTIVDNDSLELFMKFTSAGVKYYYRKNGGSLSSATTLPTSSQPSGSETYISFSISNTSSSTDWQLQYQAAAYEH